MFVFPQSDEGALPSSIFNSIISTSSALLMGAASTTGL